MNRKPIVAMLCGVFLLLTTTSHAEPALNFSGNQYVNLGIAAALQLGNNQPFTIEGWVKPSSITGTQMLYSKNNARASTYTYMFGLLNNAATITAYTGTDGLPKTTWMNIPLASPLSVGVWYHLAYSFDGRILSYYINGQLVGTVGYSFVNVPAHTAKIGGYADNTDFRGKISEMRVWNRARTATEIDDARHRRLMGGDAGLAGYWPLNDNNSTKTVLDFSGHHTTGTVINATWVDDTELGALLAYKADFAEHLPVLLADITTGNTRLTNSNIVNVAAFTAPSGYTSYQMTAANIPAALAPENWLSVTSPPEQLTFSQPQTITNLTRYVWFTNHNASTTLFRSSASIAFVPAQTVAPCPDLLHPDSYIEISSSAASPLQLNGAPFTVEGWVYHHYFSDFSIYFAKNNPGPNRGISYTYMLGARQGGAVLCAYTGAGGVPQNTWVDVPLATPIPANSWHHLAYSFDGSTMFFYLNGELVGKTPFRYGNNTAHTIKLGGYSTATDPKGSLSEIRFWDHPRSATLLRETMHQRLVGGDSGLLGYWPLDDGSGGFALDYSGNHNTGIVKNVDWRYSPTLSLELPCKAEFLSARPAVLSNFINGNTRFTNSNEVYVALSDIPENYTHYQITTIGDITAISPDGWRIADLSGTTASFPRPATDTNVALYVWYTNTTENITLSRSVGDIIYTRSLPLVSIQTTLDRTLFDEPLIIRPWEIDTETTGNQTDALALYNDIPLHSLHLQLISGPSLDLSFLDHEVTVTNKGTYAIEMVAMNFAGNVTTSALCTVTVTPFDGATFNWTGEISDDWFEPQNWDLLTIPLSGADIAIAADQSVRVTNSTPSLNSLNLHGTIILGNWETVLYARDLTISDGGLVTSVGAFADIKDGNRIQIECNNLWLHEGGSINMSGKGFRGNYTAAGNGTGAGAYYSKGAGHGGVGYPFDSSFLLGNAYGDPLFPAAPGSSGGSGYGTTGGNGGGVIQIVATNWVKLEGSIMATGVAGSTAGSAGGAGGSVSIICDHLLGSGSVDVSGGKSSAGGRIAIHYNTTSQGEFPVPQIIFRAQPGERLNFAPAMGTLYLSDSSWLADGLDNFDGVKFFGPWVENYTINGNFSPPNSIGFGEPGATINVLGDVTLDNLSLALGSGIKFSCRNLTLRNGATLSIEGALTPVHGSATTTPLYSALLDVAGTIDLASGTWIYPQTLPKEYAGVNNTNGVASLIRATTINVASEAGFNADLMGSPGGYWYNDRWGNGAMVGAGRGAGKYGTSGYGASHGGAGNKADKAKCYGNEFAPVFPGSGGPSGYATTPGHSGGGAIHLQVSDRLTLDGSITADSADNQCGGAGGSIFIAVGSVRAGANAVISASAGNASDGGGGRVAVAVGFPEKVIAELLSTGVPRNSWKIAETFHHYHGTILANHGTIGTPEPGTIRFLIAPPQGTLMLLR